MYFIRDYDGPEPYKGRSRLDVLILGQVWKRIETKRDLKRHNFPFALDYT